MLVPKLDYYLGKNFISIILRYSVMALTLIFVINFMSMLSDLDRSNLEYYTFALLVILSVPRQFELISPLIMLLSSLSFLSKYSENQEITAMRSASYSSWRLLQLIILISVACGGLVTIAFSALSEQCYNSEIKLKNKNMLNRQNPDSYKMLLRRFEGIWLKQQNPEQRDGYLLINAKDVDVSNAMLYNVQLFFFNRQNEMYKRYQLQNMRFVNNLWLLNEVEITTYAYHSSHGNTAPMTTQRLRQDSMSLHINASMQQLQREIDRAMQPVENVSFLHARRIIRDTSVLGINNRSFVVRYHYLLRMPLFFTVLSLISYAFTMRENYRSGKALYIFLGGIFVGFCLYFILELLNALIAAEKIGIFHGIWYPLLIILLVTLLIISEQQN